MKTAADLLPARPEWIEAGMLPQLPSWFPLDPAPSKEDPHPLPLTDEVRARRRLEHAAREACRGPYDGQRMVVAYPDGGEPPARFVPGGSPHVWYRLDPKSSTPHRLRYRYDPTSPIHHDLMRAVTEAYAEHGRDYTVLAREENDDVRTAPSL